MILPIIHCALLLVSAFTAPPETQRFTSFDGVEIAYTDVGEGKAIVLVHGFINTGQSWRKTDLYTALVNSGYRVIVPDLRGNGASGIPTESAAYANDAEVKDLQALLDHLRIKKCKVVGYSRGSIVLAKWLTVDRRIKQAVLGGMGIDFTNPEWDRRLLFAAAFSGEAALTPETEGAVNYARSIGANIPALGYQQQHQPVTTPAALQKIKRRILVVCGEKDQDNGDPQDLANCFKKGQLAIIPDGDHNGTYKMQRFANTVMAFLDEK